MSAKFAIDHGRLNFVLCPHQIVYEQVAFFLSFQSREWILPQYFWLWLVWSELLLFYFSLHLWDLVLVYIYLYLCFSLFNMGSDLYSPFLQQILKQKSVVWDSGYGPLSKCCTKIWNLSWWEYFFAISCNQHCTTGIDSFMYFELYCIDFSLICMSSFQWLIPVGSWIYRKQ